MFTYARRPKANGVAKTAAPETSRTKVGRFGRRSFGEARTRGRLTEALAGGGRGLSTDLRGFFEPRLGQALSRVRVHGTVPAAASAQALGTAAYAIGPNVVLGNNAPALESPAD